MGSKYHTNHAFAGLQAPGHPGRAAAVSVILTGLLVLLSLGHHHGSQSLKKLPRAELRGTPTMDLWYEEHETQVRHSHEAESIGDASVVFLGDSITQGWQHGRGDAKRNLPPPPLACVCSGKKNNQCC
jgi:hypothetical protein